MEHERADFIRKFLLASNSGTPSDAPSVAALRRRNAAAVLVPGAWNGKPANALTVALDKKSWACALAGGGVPPSSFAQPKPPFSSQRTRHPPQVPAPCLMSLLMGFRPRPSTPTIP